VGVKHLSAMQQRIRVDKIVLGILINEIIKGEGVMDISEMSYMKESYDAADDTLNV